MEELWHEYFDMQEKLWKESLPKHDMAFLRSHFPNCNEEARRNINILERTRENLECFVEEKREYIESVCSDETSSWFCLQVLAIQYAPRLLELDRQIIDLIRYLPLISQSKKLHNRDQMIMRAREHSIVSVAEEHTELSKSGSTLKGLCPLHQEKTASFYIYSEANRFKCYGCQEGGDVITLFMLLRNIGFNDAIMELQQSEG